MNKEEILAMKPGRDLNLLVCEKIFDNKTLGSVKPYSTDIQAAWQVKEKMREELFSVRWKFLGFLEELGAPDTERPVVWPSVFWFITPETICKAALLAKLE